MSSYTSLSNYCVQTAIAKFYNRDDENAVGFEMRMTHTEYNQLSNFLNRLSKDVATRAEAKLAERVRAALPTRGDGA